MRDLTIQGKVIDVTRLFGPDKVREVLAGGNSCGEGDVEPA